LDSSGELPTAFVDFDESCEPNPTCEDLGCINGTCVDARTGKPPGADHVGPVRCDCEPGYAGPDCRDCATHYEAFGVACVPSDDCDETLCNGHGHCEEAADGSLACDCDDGFEQADGSCASGPEMRIGGPDRPVRVGEFHRLGIALRNGAHCTTDFVWSLEAGQGVVVVDASDSMFAELEAHSTTDPWLGHLIVRAACGNNQALNDTWEQTVLSTASAGEPNTSALTGAARADFTPIDTAMTTYMRRTEIEGGAIAITYRGELLYLRGYGKRDTAQDEDMRTCTPMRVASVTKSLTRAAMINGVYGLPIPAALGGGTLDANTPVVQILADIMGLGAGNALAFQAPASIYAANFPGPTCNPGSGVVDPGWLGVNPGNLLNHQSGLQPNQSYRFAIDFGVCTGAVTENCGDWSNVFDPTVSTSNTTGIANILGLANGVVTADDVIRYMAGVCLYDSPAAGRFRYSNFGFTVAGRMMELITGQAYATFVPTFMQGEGVWDVGEPGSSLIYQGTNAGDGPPPPFTDPWLEESRYYSPRPDATDVNDAQNMGGNWTFPNSGPASYAARNYDLMYAHGGLVANVLALSNFIREFGITDGLPRPVPYADPGGTSQGGRLPGVQATIRTFSGEPQNSGNPNGAGCLIPDGAVLANAPTTLDVAPCPLPPGIAVAIAFNRDSPRAANFPSYVDGLHNAVLLTHMIQQALSDIGSDATVWGAFAPLDDYDRQIGCNLKCPADAPFCVPVTCGDGNMNSGEECDDGNNLNGDGCSAECRLVPPPPPQEPPGYAGCDGADPGTCLGGPCATIDPAGSDLLEWRSAAHPDGDFSPETHCFESFHDDALDWNEAVCLRQQFGAGDFGVCRECGVDTLVGCICPDELEDDGGCNPGGFGDPVLTCVGGRCYPDAPGGQPSWMCTARCDTIYGNSGYCHHQAVGDAVCYDALCSEPVDTWCNEEFGVVCNSGPTSCLGDDPDTGEDDDLCCEPECISTQDCIDRGYVNHVCDTASERCIL
jgi:cysteine-rich repeat protein